MRKVNVSVVITCYNVQEYIKKSVQSVLGHNHSASYEVIIVDDGSSDDTYSILNKVVSEIDASCNIIRQKNSGPGGARNTGIKESKGEYIIFLDGDDWLLPGSIDKLYKQIESSSADIGYSNRVVFDEKKGKYTYDYLFGDRNRLAANKMPETMKRHTIHGKIFRKKFLTKNKIYFPSNISTEDFCFNYEALNVCPSICSISNETYVYRKRQNKIKSLSQSRLSKYSLLSRFEQIERTQKTVDEGNLQKLYPNINFKKVDYQNRLLRHVKAIKNEQDQMVIDESIGIISDYLNKNFLKIEKYISHQTRELYQVIMAGNKHDIVEKLKSYFG